MRISVEPLGTDLLVIFEKPVHVVSTTIDGGVRQVKHVVFAHVSGHGEAEDKLKYYRTRLGDACIVFLTAVKPSSSCSIVFTDNTAVVATAGFDNLFTVVRGEVRSKLEYLARLDTVNILVYVDKELSLADMLELIQTVCYGKIAAMLDHDVMCCRGYALGTTTDAVAIACPCVIDERRFTGPITETGREVIRAVYHAISSLLESWGFRRDRSAERRIAEFLNISEPELLEHIIRAASQLIISPSTELRVDDLVRDLKTLLQDPNVQLLLRICLESERLAQAGSLPGRDTQRFYVQDSSVINLDELLGSIASLYVSDVYGFFNFYYYDRNKPELFRRLPPLLDDVLLGLVAGLLSRKLRT